MRPHHFITSSIQMFALLRAISFLDDEIALTFVVIKAVFNLRPGIWLLRVGFLATVSAIRRYI